MELAPRPGPTGGPVRSPLHPTPLAGCKPAATSPRLERPLPAPSIPPGFLPAPHGCGASRALHPVPVHLHNSAFLTAVPLWPPQGQDTRAWNTRLCQPPDKRGHCGPQGPHYPPRTRAGGSCLACNQALPQVFPLHGRVCSVFLGGKQRGLGAGWPPQGLLCCAPLPALWWSQPGGGSPLPQQHSPHCTLGPLSALHPGRVEKDVVKQQQIISVTGL